MRIRGVQRLFGYGSAPVGYLRSHRQIRLTWPDAPALGPRVALICHYHPSGQLREDLLLGCRELRDAGFSPVLVSNSGHLQPQALAAAQAVCASVLVRRNVGWDFCAWRDAMQQFGLPRPDTQQLLLVNDSVYGPLRPLAELLDRLHHTSGLWGMTDSHERGFHLQSYFLLAQADVLHSQAWRRFWRQVRPLPSKWLVIGRYEVGLTQALLRAGFPCRALFSRTGANAANPTLHGWRELLDAGLPFIKRELLRDNPLAAPELGTWRSLVGEIAGPAILRAIEADLPRP